MATEVKRRRGTTAQHEEFEGAPAELTVDTDKWTVLVHDDSGTCLLYTSPSPRDGLLSRMPSSA